VVVVEVEEQACWTAWGNVKPCPRWGQLYMYAGMCLGKGLEVFGAGVVVAVAGAAGSRAQARGRARGLRLPCHGGF
jgi:hypothetical protein